MKISTDTVLLVPVVRPQILACAQVLCISQDIDTYITYMYVMPTCAVSGLQPSPNLALYVLMIGAYKPDTALLGVLYIMIT